MSFTHLTFILTAVCPSRQVDMNSKNVFGQPRLRASLRDLRSPRRAHKSTIEDDLKKLIIMDNPVEAPSRDSVRTNRFCSRINLLKCSWNSFVFVLHSRHIGLCNALSQMRACAVAGEMLVMQAHRFLKDRSRPATCSLHARCLHDATTPTTEPSCLVRKVSVIC